MSWTAIFRAILAKLVRASDRGATTQNDLRLEILIEGAKLASPAKWRANVGRQSSDVYGVVDGRVVVFTASGDNHANNARHIARCDPAWIQEIAEELLWRRSL